MSQQPSFSISHAASGTVQVLALGGVLDESSGPELERRALGLPAGAASRVVLDLHGLRYASSAGISALITIHRKLRAGGGILVLAHPSDALAEMLVTLNLGSIIPVCDGVGRGVQTALLG